MAALVFSCVQDKHNSLSIGVVASYPSLLCREVSGAEVDVCPSRSALHGEEGVGWQLSCRS